MADLPKARVNESAAFGHTGVDYFGMISTREKISQQSLHQNLRLCYPLDSLEGDPY